MCQAWPGSIFIWPQNFIFHSNLCSSAFNHNIFCQILHHERPIYCLTQPRRFSSAAAAALTAMAKKNMQPSPQDKAQSYLGLLFPTEQYRVYGYITNTNAKFVLVLNDQSTAKDPEIKQVYTRKIPNPPSCDAI
jgi:hypothetical protein